MKKFKLDKDFGKRTLAFICAGASLITLSACSKKQKNETSVDKYSNIKNEVQLTDDAIQELLPNISEELSDNASIMLLLDILAPEDENEKINADIISNFKSKIDSDNMLDDFNSFLDILEDYIIDEGKVEKISSVLPEELKNDSAILSKIETILENIIAYSKEGNKEKIAIEFDKIYQLFVEENDLEIDGLKFAVRDLTYSSREVANTYAETAAYFAKDYVDSDKIKAVDERTNDQNSKAYIKSKLQILGNEMVEVSEYDVIASFEGTYTEIKSIDTEDLINTDKEKNLINNLNLKYLDSDKVSTKDKKKILGEYEDEKVNDSLTAIDKINEHNLKNTDDLIIYSNLLDEDYLNTKSGKVDSTALDFVQYNTIMLNNTVNEDTTYNDLLLNPYYNNIVKYATKQDIVHVTKNENGENIETSINWQQISDGVNFVNYRTILYSLNKISSIDEISMEDGIIDKTELDINESYTYIESVYTGECQKADGKQYIKVK